MRFTFHSAILISLVLLNTLSAVELKVGDTFPDFPAPKDQHDEDYPLPEDTRFILLSFTMPMGKAANHYLKEEGPEFLNKHNLVFVSNIYGMPAIGRLFAMPKMRRYGHRILLADQEGLLDDFPQKDERLTFIKLGPGKIIQGIHFWTPESGRLFPNANTKALPSR